MLTLSIAPDKALFFMQKLLLFFLFFLENIISGYSLIAPCWGTSNEFPIFNPFMLSRFFYFNSLEKFISCIRGWSGVAKVSCTLCHRGVQLILAYSWARPAILVAGKGIGGMFLFLLLIHFHSCSSFFPVSLFHLLYNLFSFLPFSGRWHKMTHKGWRVVKPQHNQCIRGV